MLNLLGQVKVLLGLPLFLAILKKLIKLAGVVNSIVRRHDLPRFLLLREHHFILALSFEVALEWTLFFWLYGWLALFNRMT